MLCAGPSASARVAVYNGVGSETQCVDQLVCVTTVCSYGLVIFGHAPLHEVDGEFSSCGLSVCSCPSGKHLATEFGIVHRLLLGLGQVTGVPQGLHRLSLLSHGPLGTTECSAVTICGEVTYQGGLRITEEFSADFLHSLVLSANGVLVR